MRRLTLFLALLALCGCDAFLSHIGHEGEPCSDNGKCRGQLSCDAATKRCVALTDGDSDSADGATDGDTDGDRFDSDTDAGEADGADGDTAETSDLDSDAAEDEIADRDTSDPEAELADGDGADAGLGDGDVDEESSGEIEPTWSCLNGACTDLLSGLMWQTTPRVGTISCRQNPRENAYAYCNALSLAGYNDWRLPTISELRSLIRGCAETMIGGICAVTDECLNSVCAGNCNGCEENAGGNKGCYWPNVMEGSCDTLFCSSSLDEYLISWNVQFNSGKVTTYSLFDSYYARCVRTAGTPDGDVEVDVESDEGESDGDASERDSETAEREGADGETDEEAALTWLDPTSGYRWQVRPSETFMSLSAAATYCADLNLDGYADWRLPSISELRSLIRGCESTRRGGACAVTESCDSSSCFSADACWECAEGSGPAAGCYWPSEVAGGCDWLWSSTTIPDNSACAWVVNYKNAHVDGPGQTCTAYARCMRDESGATDGDGPERENGDRESDSSDSDSADTPACDDGPCCQGGVKVEAGQACLFGQDSLACTDDVCDAAGTCTHPRKVGACLIGDTCYADHDPNPLNGCQWCDAAQNAWSYKPSSEACDDGLACTYDDHCDGSGACTGTYLSCESDPGPCGVVKSCQGTSTCKESFPDPSVPCDDNAACTFGDTCNGLGGCGGTNYSCGAGTPGACEKLGSASCKGDGSCSFTYVADAGASCNDDNACTYNDVCGANKVCAGTSYSCNGHGTCDGLGTCGCDERYDGLFCDACAANYTNFPACDQCAPGAFGAYPDCFLPSASYCLTSQCFRVPPTNQTSCYNGTTSTTCPGTAASASCGTTDFCGQDAQYLHNSRTFTCYNANGTLQSPCDGGANTDEVVADSLTGLMWQRTWNSGNTWEQAIDYCSELNYGGYSDWRLPSPLELQSIVNDGRRIPSIDLTAFPGTPQNYFWTSSSSAGDSSTAWAIDFYHGSADGGSKTYTGYYERCVRGGMISAQGAGKRYYSTEPISGEEVVTDLVTGLIWQKTYDSNKTWQQALAYCESLVYAGRSDWRLPNKKELVSLINYGLAGPAVADFPGMVSDWFWSSTSYVGNAGFAWYMSSSNGYLYWINKSDLYGARCVRGGLVGSSCSDGDPCTYGETYDAQGNCQGGTAYSCTTSSFCQTATCNGDGTCSYPAANEGVPCNDDANRCNGINTCVSGSCVETTAPIVCQTHSGCAIETGACICDSGFHDESGLCVNDGADTWATTGSLNTKRAAFGTALLSNGQVLVMGGRNDGTLFSSELYEPKTGLWKNTGSLANSRHEGIVATTLKSGQVLVTSGWSSQTYSTTINELYTPSSGQWAQTGSFSKGNRFMTFGVLLDTGLVLAAGGHPTAGAYAVAIAELYTPSGGTWAATQYLHYARGGSAQVKLPSGDVLVAGGGSTRNGDTPMDSVELYNSALGTWSDRAPMGAPMEQRGAVVLPSGLVLFVGGLGAGHAASPNCDVYDPQNNQWTTTGTMKYARTSPFVFLLPNGLVLALGSGDLTAPTQTTAEVYNPATGLWKDAANFPEPRVVFGAALLSDGRVLVVGGEANSTDETTLYGSAVIYTPDLSGDYYARPILVSAPATAARGQTITLSGSGFVGRASWYPAPAANFPLVKLDCAGTTLFCPTSEWNDSGTQCTIPAETPLGSCVLSVIVAAVPSAQRLSISIQ